jgi:CRP/FNR family transcriptional regulator
LKQNISTITENPLFAGLTQREQNDVLANAIHKSYLSQEIIVHQGDVWPNLFIVTQGEINAIKESVDGRTFIATTLAPGEVFWGLAFFVEDAPMPVMFQAFADSKIVTWRRDFLVPVIQRNGMMSWNVCQLMIKRMQLASDIVEDFAFHPVMSRLAGLLLDIFGDAEDEFKARELTLENMAARIGTTREMVCRHLYRFAEKGIIEINRTELRIIRKDYLEQQLRK